jgi:hypothetical protein
LGLNTVNFALNLGLFPFEPPPFQGLDANVRAEHGSRDFGGHRREQFGFHFV